MLSSYEILEVAGVVKFSPPDPNVSTLSIEERKRLFFEELGKVIYANYPCYIYPKKPKAESLEGFKIWDKALNTLIKYYCNEEVFVQFFKPAKKSICLYNCFGVFMKDIYSTTVNITLDISELISKYFDGLNLREVFLNKNN